jgi:Tfp pilus assembly protein PilO
MKQSKKISGVLICVLAVAFVLSLYYATIYNNLSQKVSSLELQHSENVQELSMYQSLILKKAQTKAEIADLQAKVKQYSESEETPESEIAPDIQHGLTVAGVTALNLSVEEPSQAGKTDSGKNLWKVPISLMTKCTQDELTALLHYFEKESKIAYTVDTVAVTAGQEHWGSVKDTVTVTMTANYLTQAGTVS